jgi:DNA-binding transcriptional ArsR family regulator
MVNIKAEAVNDIFQAIANETRRSILLRLADSPCVVAELARPFEMSAPAISRHLSVLERAGLVARSRSGKSQQIRIVRESLDPALRFVAELERGDVPESVSTAGERGAGAGPDFVGEDDEWTKLL